MTVKKSNKILVFVLIAFLYLCSTLLIYKKNLDIKESSLKLLQLNDSIEAQTSELTERCRENKILLEKVTDENFMLKKQIMSQQ